jgi:hypothetical protein
MSPSGEVLETSTGFGISETVRALVDKTGIEWSYQAVHRALRLTGVWVGAYRTPDLPSIRPVVAVIERTSAASLPPPSP